MCIQNKKLTLKQTNSVQAGFSLVELLVGLIIGLLATLVIMQVFAVFEGQKRSTSGNADAQTNGSIALHNMERDIQMAGYGLPIPMADKDNASLKCNPSPDFDPDNNPGTPNNIGLFPLVITDGTISDVVTARYSTTAMGAIPVKIGLAANLADISVENNIGCNDGDVVLIADGTTCMMTAIADDSNDGGKNDGANGTSNDDTHLGLRNGVLGVSPLKSQAKLTCMGKWQEFTYAVVNNQLTLNGTPVVSEVVNMQAQYGISATANSGVVVSWVNATNDVGNWVAPTVDERQLIKAVRIVVVARNGLLEKEVVTAACTTDKGVVNNGPCAWDDTNFNAAPQIDLSKNADGTDNPDWQRYRYKAFETIIPLRNMLWAKDAL